MFKSLIKLCNCSHDCWGFLRPPVLESHVKCQAGKTTAQASQNKAKSSPTPESLCHLLLTQFFMLTNMQY